MTQPEKTIIVLGMHRSGTSCLTGILQASGVRLGRVTLHNVGNPKGNRENSAIHDLHESLLAANGGSWDDPPPRLAWDEAHRLRRDRIIRELSGHGTWGFKDPRTLLAAEGWLEALPGATLLGIFRHPLAVARSLNARNGFPLAKGLDLWKLYNDRLLTVSRSLRLPLLNFDQESRAFLKSVCAVLGNAGIRPGPEALDFFEGGLRHQSGDLSEESNGESALPSLPDDVRSLLAALQRRMA